ncbi:MAG: glycosyltransferase [Treponema sp.]|nr:glycosyltransferase [Treponema sp.]
MNSVAIVMATYNGEAFLKEQIDSILDQTYRDFTLEIFDDCSTDLTENIIRSYNDNRIRYRKNSENKGYAHNFIDGMRQISSDIIFLADQDDIWFKNKLDIMISVLESQGNIGLLVSDDIDFSLKIPIVPVQNKKTGVRKVCAEEFLKRGAYRGMNIAMTRKFLLKFFNSPDFTEDYNSHDWMLECNACKYGQMYKIDIPLAFHRKHGKNTASLGNDTTSCYTVRISSTIRKVVIYTWALKHIDDNEIQKYAKINLLHHQKRLELLEAVKFQKRLLYFLWLMVNAFKFRFPKKRICADLIYSLRRM